MLIVARVLPMALTASCKVAKLCPLSTTVKAPGTGWAASIAEGSIAAGSAATPERASKAKERVWFMPAILPANG